MEYKILETNLNGDTTITKVEYNIEDNIVIVDVAHFMATDESIKLGINNRYYTEMYKIFPDRIPSPKVEELYEKDLEDTKTQNEEDKDV